MNARESDERLDGLTASEVAERVAAGRVNAVPPAPVRTLGEIVRANVFTWVNLIVGTLFVLLIVAGRPADGLFVGVILSNSVIGIVQELRARHTLEQLAVLNAPHARVRRDGTDREVDLGDVVADDVLVLQVGDQVAVDGEVLTATGLELDESLLTGEADPVHKQPGDEALSGSFVVAGSGIMRATRIGADSYAASLAAEARRFALTPSGLRADVDRILRWQLVIIPPIALFLLWRQWGLHDHWEEAVTDMVAGAVSMVPAGLALLISIAFVVGVLELARSKALAKELASVELLARVDTLCLDKTGTITTGEISYSHAETVGDCDEAWLGSALAALVASDPNPNPTLQAIGAAHPTNGPGWSSGAVVPFSSARKWAAVQVDGQGALYIGAPEILLDGDRGSSTLAEEANARVTTAAESGQRVLIVARSDEWADDRLPAALDPVGMVVLEDTVRPDAHEILAYFQQQGVTLKVISGDNPRTVSAVAGRAGVPGAEHWCDARELPEDNDELADALDTTAVFGRVSPHQKRAMVKALQSQGHTVAMTGDGVNDVLALKDADMGIAMGAGSSASRAVAQLVLLDNKFATLPVALAQGRRVINNIDRVANLFLTKTAYAITLIALVAIAGVPFPFLPRQHTLIDVFSIGVPGFLLALAPNSDPIRPGLLRRVLTFSIPSGVIAGVTTFVLYQLMLNRDGVTDDQARSAATLTLLGVALVVLVLASRPLAWWKIALAASMLASYLLVLVIDPLKDYFQLDLPAGSEPRWQIVVAIAIGGAALVVTGIITRRLESRRD
ncbi:MAG TPA: HAD-IC family P-type ATPase [Ilumatobacter sp.]|nr:HAD-IC family P-type ATPase [Ilumatobacter sp.]